MNNKWIKWIEFNYNIGINIETIKKILYQNNLDKK